jgi:hypothetical protein
LSFGARSAGGLPSLGSNSLSRVAMMTNIIVGGVAFSTACTLTTKRNACTASVALIHGAKIYVQTGL